MRIHSYSTPAELRSSKEVTRDQAAARGSSPSPADDDSVRISISTRARELASGGEVDSAKVARLREAVEKGTLQMDPHAIAAKMVEENG